MSQINEEKRITNDETLWNVFWNYVVGNQGNNNKIPYQPPRRNTRVSKKSSKVIVTKLPGETNWISALQLSLWDNISGPKVEQLWYGVETISDEVQLHAARHTLCGEIAHEESESEALIETKFHVFAELGYIFTATLFSGPWNGSTTKFSLSLVTQKEHMQRYLTLHSLVEDRMFQLVSKLRNLLKKTPNDAMTLFSAQLEPFVHKLECLYHSFLPPVQFTQTLFYQPPFFDREFLSRVITSHLQTHGSTVVIGTNEEKINMFIDSLSLFLINSSEKKRCSHTNKEYVPDLIIQGVLGDSIRDEEIIQSMLPTTLVDLQQMTVKQTHPFHEYSVLRKEYMNLEIEKLVSNKDDNLWTAQDGLFRPVKSSAPFIDRIISEVLHLPPYLRESFITQSMKLLVRKAVLLIKYVEAELSRCQPVTNLEASVVKKIRLDLELSSESDFALLLGVAEKLSPGVYVALAGDPASIELKFIELFESF